MEDISTPAARKLLQTLASGAPAGRGLKMPPPAPRFAKTAPVPLAVLFSPPMARLKLSVLLLTLAEPPR
jgi:hypothetical protein